MLDRPYICIEQYYLDTYDCVYNIKKIAFSSSYTTPLNVLNRATANAFFGLTGTSSFAWEKSHSLGDLAWFSATRGTTPLFVDCSFTLNLLGAGLSVDPAGGSARFGADVFAHVLAAPGQAVRLGTDYICFNHTSDYHDTNWAASDTTYCEYTSFPDT